MQELALNVLDIAQNSVSAGASAISVSVAFSSDSAALSISIADNGCGMSPDVVRRVTDPFYTTRTTRKVGLGVPFFKMAAEMTGGSFQINSSVGVGTTVSAVFIASHIDMMPLGDMDSTMSQLICLNENINISYFCSRDNDSFSVSTAEFLDVLDGLPMNTPQIMQFVHGFLHDNTCDLLNFDFQGFIS